LSACVIALHAPVIGETVNCVEVHYSRVVADGIVRAVHEAYREDKLHAVLVLVREVAKEIVRAVLEAYREDNLRAMLVLVCAAEDEIVRTVREAYREAKRAVALVLALEVVREIVHAALRAYHVEYACEVRRTDGLKNSTRFPGLMLVKRAILQTGFRKSTCTRALIHSMDFVCGCHLWKGEDDNASGERKGNDAFVRLLLFPPWPVPCCRRRSQKRGFCCQ
jgi:hypothetical protein